MVVEDNVKIRAGIVSRLRDREYEVEAFDHAEAGLARLRDKKQPPVHLLLLDIRLPGMTGVDLIETLVAEKGLPPTIVISGEATISETVSALKLGVYDFLEKPVGQERLLRSVANCLDHHALLHKVKDLESKIEGVGMLGETAPMLKLKQQIQKVAPTEGRVLIQGESGTGKELVANLIHKSSRRASGPFVKINCAAIPMSLIESELFGYVRGAFTDARGDKSGLFETAHGGTLFLDEIGDMDLKLQARLLRVLEDGIVRRIGDNKDRQVNVRVLTATHRDLEEMIAEGKFREDLYFRISTIPLKVPSLKERAGDVPLLFEYYLNRFCEENRFRPKRVEAEAMAALQAYAWPGNIRELRNLAERLVILAGDPIEATDLPTAVFSHEHQAGETGILPPVIRGGPIPLKTFRNQIESEYIEQVLRKTNWNFPEAAQLLGIQRTYLYQKIASLGIQKPERLEADL